MTETEQLADVVALLIHEATMPLLVKIAALEARQAIPGPVGPTGEAGPMGPAGKDGLHGKDGAQGLQGAPGMNGKDGRDGIDGKDGASGLNGKDGRDGLNGKDGASGFDGKDGRDGQPGVPGREGEKGADGLNGKDGTDGLNGKDGANGFNGADGLGFDDLSVDFDEKRGWLLRFVRETRVKEFPIPVPFDAGVWQSGRYPKGAGVTVKGAFWIAQRETTARPGEDTPESRDWRLSVKGGRDGKPGRDGKDGVSE